MEFAIAIVGIVVGFFLNVFYRSLRDTQARKRKTETSRKVVSAEISNNVCIIDEMYEIVFADVQGTDESDFCGKDTELYSVALQVLILPMPKCSRMVFDTQMSFLGQVLSEKEFLECINVYYRFDRVNSLIESIKSWISEVGADSLDNSTTTDIQLLSAKKSKAIQLCIDQVRYNMYDLYTIIVEISTIGNPFCSQEH